MYDALVDPRFGVLTPTGPPLHSRALSLLLRPDPFPYQRHQPIQRLAGGQFRSRLRLRLPGPRAGRGNRRRRRTILRQPRSGRPPPRQLPLSDRRGCRRSRPRHGVPVLRRTACGTALPCVRAHRKPRRRMDRRHRPLDRELGVGAGVTGVALVLRIAHTPGGRGPPADEPDHPGRSRRGPSSEFACWGALCEILERDAMTLSWYGGRGVHEVSVPTWLRQFARGPQGRLDTRFYSFTTEFGIPVLGLWCTTARRDF